MTWFVTGLVITIPLLTMWYVVIALLVRPFGMRLPLLFWRRNRHRETYRQLTRRQFIILVGVLFWGAGTFFDITVTNYVTSRLSLERSFHVSPGSFLGGLITLMVGGIGFGWMMWRQLPGNPAFPSPKNTIALENRDRA